MAPSIQTFLNSFSNNLEPPVRQHLKNVYACLAMSTMAAAVGAALHMFTNILQAGFLSGIGAIVFLCLLLATQDENGKGLKMRIGYLLGFTLLTGVGLGPLLEHVIAVDPSLIVTALVGTAVVFVCFSVSSLLAKRGKWLYLGGTLMSLSAVTTILALGNLFYGSYMIFQLHLYLGLVALCGFVLYDTQQIIEKRRMGSKDFVAHSLDLFVDFVGIFRRILIILTQKEQEAQKKRRN